MDSQLFLFINLILGAIFFIWFLAGRTRKEKASPLDLKKGGFVPRSPETETAHAVQKSYAARVAESQVQSKPRTADEQMEQLRQLNILFLYNGHDWDAYQVLGIPAGAGLPIVTERYQQLIQKADPGQLQFYEAAYKAILKKM